MVFLGLWIFALLISLLSFCFHKFEKVVGLISLIIYGVIEGDPSYSYGDAIVYYNDYFFKTEQFEKGYNYLTSFFGSYFDYQGFRLISSLVFILLLYLSILVITNNVSFFTLLYGIGAFPNDVQQVRNQMATVFVLLSLCFLYKFGKKGFFFSCAFIYIGSLFHSISLLFFIIPILFYVKNLQKNFVKLSFAGLCLAIFVELLSNIPNLNGIISQALFRFSSRESSSSNVMNIYSNNVTPFTIWILTILTTFVMFYITYAINNNEENILLSEGKLFFIKKISIISFLIWLVGLILLASSIEYIRILRICSVMLFTMLAALLESSNASHRGKLALIAIIFSLLLMWVQAWIYYTNVDNWLKALNFTR